MLIFPYKRTREPLQRLSIQCKSFHSSKDWYNATAIRPADDGLPKSMQQIPSWKDDVSLASQEIPRVHNSQPLCPFREPDEPCAFNNHFNAILPSTTRSAKRSLPYRFPNQNPVCISLLLHTYHVIRPSQPPPSVRPDNILSGIQAIKLLITHSSTTLCHLFPASSKYLPH